MARSKSSKISLPQPTPLVVTDDSGALSDLALLAVIDAADALLKARKTVRQAAGGLAAFPPAGVYEASFSVRVAGILRVGAPSETRQVNQLPVWGIIAALFDSVNDATRQKVLAQVLAHEITPERIETVKQETEAALATMKATTVTTKAGPSKFNGILRPVLDRAPEATAVPESFELSQSQSQSQKTAPVTP